MPFHEIIENGREENNCDVNKCKGEFVVMNISISKFPLDPLLTYQDFVNSETVLNDCSALSRRTFKNCFINLKV